MPSQTAPLKVFNVGVMPSTLFFLRSAIVIGAVFVAAISVALPWLTGEEDPLITTTLLGVAALEIGVAFALPKILSSRSGQMVFKLYADHIEFPALAGRTAVNKTLPYSEISRVEAVGDLADKDIAAGFTGVRLYLAEPRRDFAGTSYYGMAEGRPAVTLRGLRSEENPLSHIKELVEKSKSA